MDNPKQFNSFIIIVGVYGLYTYLFRFILFIQLRRKVTQLQLGPWLIS